jgi:hypothetical protein
LQQAALVFLRFGLCGGATLAVFRCNLGCGYRHGGWHHRRLRRLEGVLVVNLRTVIATWLVVMATLTVAFVAEGKSLTASLTTAALVQQEAPWARLPLVRHDPSQF